MISMEPLRRRSGLLLLRQGEKVMKKIKNDGLQILGIVLSMVGIATTAQPLIRALFGKPLKYQFLGLLPDGWASFAAWAVILVVGLVLVTITQGLTSAKKE
jgi:hypothetical protein